MPGPTILEQQLDVLIKALAQQKQNQTERARQSAMQRAERSGEPQTVESERNAFTRAESNALTWWNNP